MQFKSVILAIVNSNKSAAKVLNPVVREWENTFEKLLSIKPSRKRLVGTG